MDEKLLLDLLRFDLNRSGARPDDDYLRTLIRAAKQDIERSGIALPTDDKTDVESYQMMVVGTAAWMYTKRRTGEAIPAHVRSLRNRALHARKAGMTDA